MTSLPTTIALALLTTRALLQAADHGHLNGGAVGVKQNDPLIFANAADFRTASGYVKTLTFTNGATYAGYYQGNITLTALAQTPANAGPVPLAPAPGSFIQFQIVSVNGPKDGAFAFWNTGAAAPSDSVKSGQTSTNLWKLTESDGSPGADPYGHIHGRRFTATRLGIYKVGFRLFDTSTNGLGGGPIHLPSEVLEVCFEAGVNIQSVEPDEDHSHIRFAAPVGNNWQLETADSLNGPPKWLPVGDPVVGDDLFHAVEHDVPVLGKRFYRVRSVVP